MRHTLLIFLLSFIPLSVHAIIPLELVAEFDLPQNAVSWDVQHWTDDSTFGWAAIVGDTIYYQTQPDAEIAFTVLDTDTFHDPPWNPYVALEEIAIYKSPSRPDHLTVLGLATQGWNTIQYDKVFCFDLTNNEYFGAFTDILRYYEAGTCWSEYEREQLQVWPSPPAVTNYWSCQQHYSSTCDGAGENGYWWGSSNDLHAVETSYLIASLQGSSVDAFYNIDELGFVFAGRHRSIWYCDCIGEPGETCWTATNTRAIGNFIDTLTVQLVESSVVAGACSTDWQSAGGFPGRERVVAASNGENSKFFVGLFCYNLQSFSPIYQLPEHPSFTLKCNIGAPDLVFCRTSSQRWNVYDVEFGTLLDSTTMLNDQAAYALHSPSRISELVCTGSNPNSIRVYRPSISLDLSIFFDDVTSSVVLNWSSVPLATSYEVCRSQTADGDFCEHDIISAADTFLTLPLINGVNKEFFRVRTVFE